MLFILKKNDEETINKYLKENGFPYGDVKTTMEDMVFKFDTRFLNFQFDLSINEWFIQVYNSEDSNEFCLSDINGAKFLLMQVVKGDM